MHNYFFLVDDNTEFNCKKLPVLPHVEEKVLRGEIGFSSSRSEIALKCAPGYINTASAASCDPVILRCAAHGVWIGDLPTCGKYFTFNIFILLILLFLIYQN